jgi:HlyD family type I secretion membrane fusion protein
MNPDNAMNKVFYSILAFVVIAVIWALNAKLDQAIRAEGQVEPMGKVQVVQNRYPGSVKKFSVAVGDLVEKGDVLFWLEDEEIQASLIQNRVVYFTSVAQSARHEAEAFITKLSFSAEIPEQYTASQYSIYQSKQAALNEQLGILDAEINSRLSQIKQTQASVSAAHDSLDLTQEELSIYEPLVKAGAEPKVRLLGLRRQLLEANDNITQKTIAQEGHRIDIIALDRRKDQALMDFKVEAKERLVEAQNTAAKAKAEFDALNDKLSMAQVKAPVSGIISSLNVTTRGSVLKGGDTLAEIVPQSSSYRILAKVKPADIGLVTIGQVVKVSFTAYDFAKYGSIEGRVMTIAQNITETQRGDLYYEVWVETTTQNFSKSSIVPNLMPGMVAQVDILGEKKTVMRYILAPMYRTADRALTEL